MQWDMNQNRGTPSTNFVGGFHFPRMGPPEQQNLPIANPGIYGARFTCTSQHLYIQGMGFPYETRQRAMPLQTVYTHFHGTSHMHSRSSSTPHNPFLSLAETFPPEMPQLQFSDFWPPEPAPPFYHQTPQPYAEPSNPRVLVRPPRPEEKLTHPRPRIFYYSKCTGRKKAVCVGINYTGTKGELRGCVNDAKNVCRFLTRNWNFRPEDIVLLTDDTKDRGRLPTKANIIKHMKWLVKDARAQDSLFFHFSGHGIQIPDTDGDERDGYDEAICPLDYDGRDEGAISDDTMNRLLVHPIPDGCRLTALFDSCNSGSILDLVYHYGRDGRLKKSDVKKKFHREKSSDGDVISFSGCKDGKTSADVKRDGRSVGAMSHAFIKCLEANPKQSYKQLLNCIRENLREDRRIRWKNRIQKPQLSSSHRMDINRRFII